MYNLHASTDTFSQSNMEYPIGSPTCWNASNVNCTDHTPGHNTEQCSFGCSYNAGEEIAAMPAYDNGARRSSF